MQLDGVPSLLGLKTSITVGAKADGVQVSELTRIGTARSCVGLGELLELGWNALLRVLPRRVELIPHSCYRSRGRDNEFYLQYTGEFPSRMGETKKASVCFVTLEC